MHPKALPVENMQVLVVMKDQNDTNKRANCPQRKLDQLHTQLNWAEGALALNLKPEIRFALNIEAYFCFSSWKIPNKNGKLESLRGKHTCTHTGIRTALRVLRPAKSVLALVRLAAGDRGAVVDCFLVHHFQLRQLSALQQKVISAQVDDLNVCDCEANDERL